MRRPATHCGVAADRENGVRMINRSLELAFRTRWAAPALVVLVVGAMAVNETAYQTIDEGRARTAALVDARVAASDTVRALARLEAAARAYGVGRDPVDKTRFADAREDLHASREQALSLLGRLETRDAPAAVPRLH